MIKKNLWKIKVLIILVLVLGIFGMDRLVTRIDYEKQKVTEYILVNSCAVTNTDQGKVYLCRSGRQTELELVRNALHTPDNPKE